MTLAWLTAFTGYTTIKADWVSQSVVAVPFLAFAYFVLL